MTAAEWWCECGRLMRAQPDGTFKCPECDTIHHRKPKHPAP